jgi:hypothetical protein
MYKYTEGIKRCQTGFLAAFDVRWKSGGKISEICRKSLA